MLILPEALQAIPRPPTIPTLPETLPTLPETLQAIP